MPRVMVISDEQDSTSSVLLDEQVSSIHLDSEHSAWQFIERLGWAISDAEDAEQRLRAAEPHDAERRPRAAQRRIDRGHTPSARESASARQSPRRHPPRTQWRGSRPLQAAS